MFFNIRSTLLTVGRSFSSKTLFVGNLPWKATNEELGALFARFGSVKSARIVQDRESGRSRGFGFVEMDDDGAVSALEKLNGSDFQGRDIQVREGKPQAPRQDRRPR
ncbi:hypothetical protein HDU67_007759 [Dinochytrium kinnereticum]|nr:hypothetical protein HDU67_007759 [Dinochytrium kinnereticum]